MECIFMAARKDIDVLKKTLERAKLICSEAGMGATEIASKFQDCDTKIQALCEELEQYEGMLRGVRIAQLGTHFSAQAGKSVQPGLFEMYEFAKEKEKLFEDAGLFYKLWQSSLSGNDLRSKLSASPLRTFTFGLVVLRVAEHFLDVQSQFAVEQCVEV
jgi:hypothetical protein